MRKIAIIGLSMATHDQAPFEDPEWEIWGLPWDAGYWVHFDRMFEMHDRELWMDPRAKRAREPGIYLEKLQDAWVPIYMHEAQEDIEYSVRYPFEAVEETVWYNFPRRDWQSAQRDWYSSSPAYMLALAIHELDHSGQIGIWGVDLKDTQFGKELPCLNFLMGYALGRGIDVYLPEGPTELGKFDGEDFNLGDMIVSYPERYGTREG